MLDYFIWLVFSFNGRIGRGPYFLATVALSILAWANMGSQLVDAFGMLNHAGAQAPDAARQLLSLLMLSLFRLALSLAIVWAQTAVAAKRLHDINMSGWWQAAPIALFVASPFGLLASNGMVVLLAAAGGIVALVLGLLMLFKPGSSGDNRFPRGPSFGGDGDSNLSKISFDPESLARYRQQNSAKAMAGAAASQEAQNWAGGAPARKEFGQRGARA